MAGAFTAVDLSKLPAPDVVEQLDYEAILAAMVADLQARDPAFSAMIESDPAYKILEICAYRELIVRQRVNDGARAVMLAYAGGTDLDQIAANYNVVRLLLDAGDPDVVPPVPPTYEDDTSLRRRVQLSFEGFSTAGPEGAYIFHALGADADVLDASVASPAPGELVVTVLSRTGDGTADAALLTAVDSTLNADDVRPLTDQVTVQSAEIVNYSVTASLTLYPGPDSAVVLAAAQSALDAYIESNHRLGRDVTLSGLYAALHREGVQNVTLSAPGADIVIASHQAAYCTGTTVTTGGTDE
ncbi:baseplate J/gp47 family protein [Marinobacterium sp. AK62]|uniref:Baseplate J/gp47 family protein n=1 Tax=Marinobacterium alkalitolerans TaxID=1542925 RepID=A0ABS3Z7G2_9GAMM|nr:baseplate J/gp47 family protein [Marinobacterium alkalitolerans]MBP0047649.1 baseplate J/gp47 family protein [Marinobacterium alkalitolerans]